MARGAVALDRHATGHWMGSHQHNGTSSRPCAERPDCEAWNNFDVREMHRELATLAMIATE